MKIPAPSPKILDRAYFLRPTRTVARDLLGSILCVRDEFGGIVRTRIVETEAYLGTKDEACHSFGGTPTPRTEVMYLAGGHIYVYFIYGMHFCLNVVTLPEGVPEAVLIRAVEPIADAPPERKSDYRTNGPGKLARALGITRADNGIDACTRGARIWFEAREGKRGAITTGPRVGIDSRESARDLPLRFYLTDSSYVSKRITARLSPK